MNNAAEIQLDCANYQIPDCIADKNGSLSGLRLGVKDLFHIAGLPTTAGNPDWLKTHPTPSSTSSVVKTLIEQGAELTAKTLTDEIAYSLNGVNSHYGTPINPADNTRIPGGSSSGSAVAVANGTIDIGLGTDTGGSIRVPASYNGLYGFRPSHGVVAVDNLVGLAPGFDTVGWLTRDFTTLHRVASCLVPEQPSSKIERLVVALPQGLSTQGLSMQALSNWKAIVDALLPKLNAIVSDVCVKELPQAMCAKASDAFRTLQGRQIWREHGDWIEGTEPTFADDISARFQWCKSLTQADENSAELLAQEFLAYWQREFITDSATAVLCPTTPGAAPKLTMADDELASYRNHLMGLTAPAGLAKAPQISLPLMSDQHAPWGISLIGQYLSDQAVLNLAKLIDDSEVNNKNI